MTPAALREWLSAAGGRRFIMCMGAHFINTALFATHFLSESGYLTTFGGTVAAYLAAAGWQKHMELKSQ
jgi:hypothetical protein